MDAPGLRSIDRILTTHVGSLIRPDDLVAALQARRAGDGISDDELAALLSDRVREVVLQQAEVGIDLVSDGEFGKTISWSRYILERLDGFEDRSDPAQAGGRPARPLGPRTDIELFPDFYAEYNKTQGFEDVMRNPVCVGPISYVGQDALQRDIANVVSAVEVARAAGHEVSAFLPVVAPASVAYKRQDVHYATEEEYVYAVAEALREEYR
ncbi:MAG TPA: hypothetical protein VID93_11640, partial [Acidimicrobiales bacterium]